VTTLADLISPKTQGTIESEILADLTTAGFPVTSWQSGSVPRTMIRALAVVLAHLYALVALIAGAAFLDTSTGGWLTLLAASRFDVTRIAATFAEHSLTVTVASGAGPYTITPGQLVLASSTGAVRFRSTNTSNVTVSTGSPATITVRAEVPGTSGNATPVTIVAPALAGLGITYGSLTLRARAEESDAALRLRCRTRWATLAAGATREAYEYHLRSATLSDGVTSAGVTRVGWITPPGDGTLEAVVAGDDGPLSSDQLTAARAYLAVSSRHAATDTLTITNATSVTVTPDASIAVRAAYNTSANRQRAVDALTSLAASLAIGQTLDLGAVYAAIYAAQGLTNVTLSAPASDTACTARQVIVILTGEIGDAANWVSV
jgi:phage-related baseplate assembly protein